MALHPNFPRSPYEILPPDQRWFPAAEEMRDTAYEKLLPPLVAKVREEVGQWRNGGYLGASDTSRALLKWWFETDHLVEQGDGTQSQFRYYFAQREAVETVIWLHDVRGSRDKFDLMRFDASGAVSTLPGFEAPQGELALPQFEERWTGGYIFENEWQSFRTRQNRDLELTTALHTYDRPGRYTVAVKVIDIFGNDTMTLVPVNVG
jgi:hypothetical protein